MKQKQTPSTPPTEALIGTSTLAVTEQAPAADWLPISPDRWYSTDGRYVLLQVDPATPIRPSLRTRLQTLFAGPRPAGQDLPPVPGALPEVVAATRWSQPVRWTPAKADQFGAGEAWLGVDGTGRDIVLPTCSRSDTGQVRVHHGHLVGRTGTGKSGTLKTLLLPGLSTGTELVLAAVGADNPADPAAALRDLDPYLARVARPGDAGGWSQVITLAWQILNSRHARGWSGPSPTDPVITLAIDDAPSIKDHLNSHDQNRVLEITRMGETLGVRVIQTTHTGATADLIGENSARSNIRWTIAHAAASGQSSAVATSSTTEHVSLLGLPVGHAAVIVEGRVLTPEVAIAVPTPAAIDEALTGVRPAQLHLDDEIAAGDLWDATAGLDHRWAGGQH